MVSTQNMVNINGHHHLNVANGMASYNIESAAIEKEVLHIFILSCTGTRCTINDMSVIKQIIVQLATADSHPCMVTIRECVVLPKFYDHACLLRINGVEYNS